LFVLVERFILNVRMDRSNSEMYIWVKTRKTKESGLENSHCCNRG
jgi:hypothetical protein